MYNKTNARMATLRDRNSVQTNSKSLSTEENINK